MDDTTRLRRSRTGAATREGNDPALFALAELLESERLLAASEAPDLVERADAGRLWLLWFAIGATDEVCKLTQRRSENERNDVFRQVVSMIFNDGVRSDVNPILADRELIELFERAGSRAVQACMTGETRLGYYLEALRTGLGHRA
jgi:hypothetical protein